MKRTTQLTLGTVKRQRTLHTIGDGRVDYYDETLSEKLAQANTLSSRFTRGGTQTEAIDCDAPYERVTADDTPTSAMTACEAVPGESRTVPSEVLCEPERVKQRKDAPLSEADLPPLSDEQQAVLDAIVESRENAFITGGAGVGKSLLLKALFFALQKKWKVKALAPTGAAALLIPYGRTYHSYLGCGAKDTLKKMITNARYGSKHKKFSRFKQYDPEATEPCDVKHGKPSPSSKCKPLKDCDTHKEGYAFIIDEASMIPGMKLDMLDMMLRALSVDYDRPFGGHRVVLIGDLFQLGPVRKEEGLMFKSDFFRSAVPLRFNLVKCFRQSDAEFVALLGHLRTGQMTASDHMKMRALAKPELTERDLENYIKIVPTNKMADELNARGMDKLSGVIRTYRATDTGSQRDLLDELAPAQLTLKVGARVMVTRNISRTVVNGSTGTVLSLEDTFVLLRLDAVCGENVQRVLGIPPWEFSVETKSRVLAKRTIFPLRLAYAITTHKAQGKSLDRVLVDCENTFACGQLYVAASRARTLEGLVVRNYAEKYVKADPEVVEFMRALFQ